MRRTAATPSAGRCCAPREQPLPNRRGKIGHALGVEPLRVDLRHQSVERAAALAGRGLERAPEHRLEADRRLVAGDQDRPFLRRSVVRRHQYMCWPPLIDRVEPVTKPAFSSTRKATPRAISSALPSRPTGIRATILPRTSSGTAATMSVSM